MKALYWIPSLVWMVFIWIGSSRPNPGLSQPKALSAHFLVFAILAALFVFGFAKTTALDWRWILVLSVVLTSAYGGIDEFHQSFAPGRSMNLTDWLTDTLAAAAVSACLFPLWLWRRGRLAQSNPLTVAQRLSDGK